MRRTDNKKEIQEKGSHKKHRLVAIIMAVFLVSISIAGLYVLNAEGIINISLIGTDNWDLSTSGDSDQTPAMEPEITPGSTPEPTEKVFIPDVGELQELPDPALVELTESKLKVETTDGVSVISWDEYPDASYYVLAAYNGDHVQIQKDILWSNITTWQIPNFAGGKIILYIYKDMGVDGSADDRLMDTYAYEVSVTENISSPPADVYQYYLLVDKSSFAISVFTVDENGAYTVLLYTFPCALGESDRMTAVGSWEISSKGPWKLWSTGWYSPYYSKFTAGLYIHGAVYAEDDFSTLSPTSYEKIGTKATSGCIRTTVEGAEWIYYNCPAGTMIEIVDSSELVVYPGKPAVDPDYPNWDPTDPNKPGN